MVTRFVAVIDLGKTNSKVALVDTQTATEVEVLTQPSAVDLTSIYPSLDHQAIKAFVIDSLTSLAAVHVIDAITVTTHGATAALIKDDGELALPVLDYEYQDVNLLRSDYDEHRPRFSVTGSPALPGGLNIGAQMYWQTSNFPHQFANAQTMLTWPQYWVHWLTGERYNDVSSLGCHTDLYEPRTQCYSSLVGAMDWSALMPPVKNSGEFCGVLMPSLAKLLGLGKAIPVYTGIHDSNASLVPHLLTQEAPFSVVSTGTWFIVMAVGGEPLELDESRDTLLNVNAKGGCVPSARFMGGRERDILTTASEATDESLSELLSNHGDPSMLMPSMVPNTGPYPKAVSCWVGAHTEQGSAMRDSAIALYLALMTLESMKLVGCAGPTFIEGPLAHDKQFAQMLCAVSARSVFISGAQTGTSVGAAMLINAPTKPPVYEAINLSSDRRDELIRYAKLWQAKLVDHAK